MRASLPRLFFGANLKEQPLCRSVYYCWLKPARQSSRLELTRIVEEFSFMPMSKCTKRLWNGFINTKIPFQNCTFLDSRVQNVPDISLRPTLPWLVQNRTLRCEENKVEFLQGHFRNKKLSFVYRKGNCVLSGFKTWGEAEGFKTW